MAVTQRVWPTYVLLALALVAVHGLVVRLLVPGVTEGSLIDPDSYTRLVRVAELYRGGGWFDRVLDRMNAPYGLELHWTRPFDIILLAGAWPLSLFMGFDPALHWTGVLVSPAVHILVCLGLAWAVAPHLAASQRPLVVLVFLIQPLALTYAYAGRADHHMLLLLDYVLALGLFARSVSRPDERRWSLFSGAAIGFGLWLSVEFLFPLATLYLPLAVAWMIGFPRAGRACLLFSIGLVTVVGLGVFIEGGPGGLVVVEYDRISAVHVLLAGTSTVLWAGILTMEGRDLLPAATGTRALFLAAVGLVTLVPILLAFPGLVVNPMADLDPRFETLLLDQTVELQPLLPSALSEVGSAVAKLGHAVVALPFLVWRALIGGDATTRLLWLPLLLALLLLFPLGLDELRYGIWATVPMAVGVGGLVSAMNMRLSGSGFARTFARASLVAGLLLVPLVIGGALLTLWGDRSPPPPRAGAAGCSVPLLASGLSTGPEWIRPRVILAHPNIGPELVYRSTHSVVAAPYHRNVEGILDAHDIFVATRDEEARALIDERGIDLVIVCPEGDWWFLPDTEDIDRMLFSRLLRDQPPSWLERMELPGPMPSGFLVFRLTDG